MAITTYTCNTCHRSVDIPRNKKGFEVFRNCIITLNCKGVLALTANHPEYVRGAATSVVTELTDYVQRLVLYKHTQKVAATTWNVKHNLNNIPDVTVYTYNGNDELVKTIPLDIIHINTNYVRVLLPLKHRGVVECIAKYNNTSEVVVRQVTDSLIQISNNHQLTFAVSRQFKNPVIKFAITSAGSHSTPIIVSVELTHNNSLLAWGDGSIAYFNNKNFKIYTVDLSALIPDNMASAYALTPTSLTTDILINSPINNHKGLIWILRSNGSTYSDKVLTSVIDVTSLTNQNNITSNNITSINSNIITDMYPTIKVT